MAKQFQYTFVFKAGNVFTRSLLALGISFNGSALITVPGTQNRRTPFDAHQHGRVRRPALRAIALR